MKILYAGDGPAGGSAIYLLGVLGALGADVRHVPPAERLTSRLAAQRYDAILLSDFPHRRLPVASETAIVQQVAQGTGLLMVGGWGSFAGPLGGWRGSKVASLLPVTCLARDDRVHFPGGALVCRAQAHPMWRSLSFSTPPVICGLNAVRPRRHSRLLLTARRIMAGTHPGQLRLDAVAHPLLIIDADPRKRIAALATDLAPHWCGGLVDWGTRRSALSVNGALRVEVGDRYVQFVASLVRWLAKAA